MKDWAFLHRDFLFMFAIFERVCTHIERVFTLERQGILVPTFCVYGFFGIGYVHMYY